MRVISGKQKGEPYIIEKCANHTAMQDVRIPFMIGLWAPVGNNLFAFLES